jgi:hypothetical protein
MKKPELDSRKTRARMVIYKDAAAASKRCDVSDAEWRYDDDALRARATVRLFTLPRRAGRGHRLATGVVHVTAAARLLPLARARVALHTKLLHLRFHHNRSPIRSTTPGRSRIALFGNSGVARQRQSQPLRALRNLSSTALEPLQKEGASRVAAQKARPPPSSVGLTRSPSPWPTTRSRPMA